MKLHIIISFIYVAIIARVNSAPNTDFNQVATDLLNRLTTLKGNANQILIGFDNLQAALKQKTDTLDFGIPQDLKIIELINTLKQYHDKGGIAACMELKDENIQIVTQELKDLITKKIVDQLYIDKLTLNSILQTLESIFEHLQGSNLDAEIKFCQDDEQNCRLTNEYSKEVDHSQQATEFINTTSQTLLDVVLKTSVFPQLTNTIITKIYNPVMLCINNSKSF